MYILIYIYKYIVHDSRVAKARRQVSAKERRGWGMYVESKSYQGKDGRR